MSDVIAEIKVDVWSDIACPWCYIGKRRFEEALNQYKKIDGAADVIVQYHSYELAPDTPVDFEGSEIDFLSQHKGIPANRIQSMLTQVTKIAQDVGLDYDFDRLQHTNTRRAHQLLHLSKKHGLQAHMKERLLSAYFEEGRHVGRIDSLVDLAVEVGIDSDEARTALVNETYESAVTADIEQAKAYGITGVPFFVLNGKYGISGAQEPRVFVEALARAADDGDTSP